tara:strand:+ start:21314 stop:22093 length:780 start_codon:yes stop_codon:yes gene_type:complete
MEISICIVTFKERAEDIKRLVSQIRADNDSDGVDIILAINGNIDERMDEYYRKEMMELCSTTPNCYPIFCPEFKSLPKLWNTLAIFSRTEYNLLLGDDVEYTNTNTIREIKDYILNSSDSFFTINQGFSHFVLTKTILHELKYFDERFCAYGEEDGDMVHRFIDHMGTEINNIFIGGLHNKALYDSKSNQQLDFHESNKPKFNREFCGLKYENNPNGIRGMSPTPVSVKSGMEVLQQYPYEEFVRKNKHNITKFKEIVL